MRESRGVYGWQQIHGVETRIKRRNYKKVLVILLVIQASSGPTSDGLNLGSCIHSTPWARAFNPLGSPAFGRTIPAAPAYAQPLLTPRANPPRQQHLPIMASALTPITTSLWGMEYSVHSKYHIGTLLEGLHHPPVLLQLLCHTMLPVVTNSLPLMGTLHHIKTVHRILNCRPACIYGERGAERVSRCEPVRHVGGAHVPASRL